MTGWPDRRILDLFKIELPVIQAPMAGANLHAMVIAVSEAGGLGSLPCAMLNPQQLLDEMKLIRTGTRKPVNLNFFCHRPAAPDAARDKAWKDKLAHYYVERGLDPAAPFSAANRAPFDAAMCDVVAEVKPEVVSFHFGLPDDVLLARVRGAGAKIISSATSVEEALWLERKGCDAIIAQGAEAGGHRGVFLTDDISTQAGTIALVPQIVDAVKVPVIASGGIADGRGISASFMLGASAAQLGTAYLFCPEATIGPVYRHALKQVRDNNTVLTNVFSGRPARGMVNRLAKDLGPMSADAPAFPAAAAGVAPLRAKAEAMGSGDFTSLWSGQAARLARELPAGELTRVLAADALKLIKN